MSRPKLNARAKRRRYWLNYIKMKCGCALCGYRDNPLALQFDHIGNKTKQVSHMVLNSIVNLIKETPVRGYEIFAKDVTITKQGYYRAWIGLRLPMGEYNKMYNFTIAEAVDAYNIKEIAQIAYDEAARQAEKVGKEAGLAVGSDKIVSIDPTTNIQDMNIPNIFTSDNLNIYRDFADAMYN